MNSNKQRHHRATEPDHFPHLLRHLRALTPPGRSSPQQALHLAELQAKLFRSHTERRPLRNPEDIVGDLPHIRLDYDTRPGNTRIAHWHTPVASWIIPVPVELPEAYRRVAILKAFKTIIDYPYERTLYGYRTVHGHIHQDAAATQFALGIVLPRSMAELLIDTGITTLELASIVGLDLDTTETRLNELGLLDQNGTATKRSDDTPMEDAT